MELANTKYLKNTTVGMGKRVLAGQQIATLLLPSALHSAWILPVLGTHVLSESLPTSHPFSYWFYSAVLNNSLFYKIQLANFKKGVL